MNTEDRPCYRTPTGSGYLIRVGKVGDGDKGYMFDIGTNDDYYHRLLSNSEEEFGIKYGPYFKTEEEAIAALEKFGQKYHLERWASVAEYKRRDNVTSNRNQIDGQTTSS
jgi:hypothetical protein